MASFRSRPLLLDVVGNGPILRRNKMTRGGGELVAAGFFREVNNRVRFPAMGAQKRWNGQPATGKGGAFEEAKEPEAAGADAGGGGGGSAQAAVEKGKKVVAMQQRLVDKILGSRSPVRSFERTAAEADNDIDSTKEEDSEM